MKRIFYVLLRRKPFLLLISLIGLSRMLAAFIPFRVSGSIENLLSTNLVPFTYLSLGALFLDRPNQYDQASFDITVMMADFLFWMAAGYLLRLCYRLYWERKPYGKKLLYGLPPLYFAFIELSQLLIPVQTSDINDIISGCGGVYAGYIAYTVLRKSRRRTYHTPTDLLKIPLVIYGIFMFFCALRPFDWLFHPQISPDDWSVESLILFYGYFRHESSMSSEFFKSLTLFLPVSLYWSYKLRGSGKPYPHIYANTIITGMVLGMLIEVLQLFSTARMAHITDLLAWAASGALGTGLIYYYEYHTLPTLNSMRKNKSAPPAAEDPLSQRLQDLGIPEIKKFDDGDL